MSDQTKTGKFEALERCVDYAAEKRPWKVVTDTPEQARAELARAREMRELLEKVWPVIEGFSASNPVWFDRDGGRQDPYGVHELCAAVRRVLGGEE